MLSRDAQTCQAWFPTTALFVFIFGGKWDMMKHYFPKEDSISLTIYNPQIIKYDYLGTGIIFQWLFQLLPNCEAFFHTAVNLPLMHSSWETASGQQLQVCSLYTVTHSLTRRGWGNQLCPLLSCDWLHMPSASSWKTVRGVTPVWTFVGWCSVPWGIRCLFYIEGMRLCVCIMTCVPVCLLLLLNHSPHRRHPWKHVEVSGVTDCSLCVCAKGKSRHKGKIVMFEFFDCLDVFVINV